MIKRRFIIMERFTIYGTTGCFTGGFIGSYPHFKSLQEGLDYIHKVLDPYYTGKYGIVINDE